MTATTPRRTLMAWLPWVVVIGFIGVVTFFSRPPELSAQERQMVGIWGGLDTRNAEEPYAWRVEYREDRTIHILFRHFYREEMPGVSHSAASGEWLSRAEEERGRWRVKDGIYIADTFHPDQRRSFWEKLQYFRITEEWPGDEVYHEEYVIEQLDNVVFNKRGKLSGSLFVSRRGSPLTELPDQPLPPEQWVK